MARGWRRKASRRGSDVLPVAVSARHESALRMPLLRRAAYSIASTASSQSIENIGEKLKNGAPRHGASGNIKDKSEENNQWHGGIEKQMDIGGINEISAIESVENKMASGENSI
jgi:hypothetical protein